MEMFELELLWNPDKREAWNNWVQAWMDRGLEQDSDEMRAERDKIIANPLIRLCDLITTEWMKPIFFLINLKYSGLDFLLNKTKLNYFVAYNGQNLKRRGDRAKSFFHRRDIFYLMPRGEGYSNRSFRVEFAIPSSTFGIHFTIDPYDDPINLSLCCGLFGLYLSFDFFPRRFLPKSERDTSIRFFEGLLWINLWHDDGGYEGDRFSWQQIVIHFDDIVLGKEVYAQGEKEYSTAIIDLPEKRYLVDIAIYPSSWKRPRWKKVTVTNVDITPKEPIPIPGKGENNYDQDENASYSATIRASSVEEALTIYTDSILRDRLRHGGEDWIPEACRTNN
ncbi:MAG: hypothetical protein WBB28_02010 [Crinalium sp.]